MLAIRKRPQYVVVALLVLAGCANVTKEQFGTAAGMVIGAAVGSKVGGRGGAAAGALIGSLIGNRIGAHLDEEDLKKLSALEQNALATGTGGSFVTNKSKARVTVEASPITHDRKQEFALSSTLTPQPLILLDPYTVVAFVDTPVYHSTNDRDRPKAMVQRGVPMRISAFVIDKDWAVVGEGIGWGYVPRRYLEERTARAAPRPQFATAPQPAPAAPRARGAASAPATATATAAAARNAAPPTVNKDQYEREMTTLMLAYQPRASAGSAQLTPISSPGAAAPPAAAPARPVVQTVQASTECKVLTRRIEGGGEGAPLTEQIKYCKEPPRGWQTQTA